MTALEIAWRSVQHRPVLNGLAALVLAAGVAASLALTLLAGGLHSGLVRAADPFGLIVGAKGSPNQLVLSTIYLQDAPPGNLPLDVLEVLRADPRVGTAVPLALGDVTGGYPLLGTEPAFFELSARPNAGSFFCLAAGRLFEADFEAVAGASTEGLGLGATFISQHGTLGSERWHESFSYHVVGRLERTGTPLDHAVFVPLSSYWEVHEAEGVGEASDQQHEREVTAIVVNPVGLTELYQLHQEINSGSLAQAVLPGQVVGRLLDLLDHGERLLSVAVWITAALAACTVFLGLYAAAEARRRQVAILRGLGAPWGIILSSLVWESLLVVLVGTALGLVLGHGFAWVAAEALERQVALVVIPSPTWRSAEALLLVLTPSLPAALCPVLAAYRRPPAADLAV